jgi:hypothetical protein
MMSSITWSICTLSVTFIACGSDATPPPIDATPADLFELVSLAGDISGPGNLDGTGASAHFHSPSSVAIDSTGNLYVADESNHTIRRVSAGGIVTTYAGTAGVSGSTDGTGAAARFLLPSGVAIDGADNIYVADRNNHTIRKITAAGAVTTLAGTPGVSGSTDGTGAAARFNGPGGLTVDGAGNVYVADWVNYIIRKVTAAGVVTTLAGTAGVRGSADGTGAAASFNNPVGVAVDSAGNVYVADGLGHTIRKITAAGVVTTLAGTVNTPGSTDGPAATALFRTPHGMAVDSAGNVYVSERSNHTIRKITAAGTVTTLAGKALTCGNIDSTGPAARFCLPSGIDVDSAGNLYVGDASNSSIRKITAAGVVTTLAGSTGYGSADGTGPAARFGGDTGVAVDSTGNIYVADQSNSTIRKITDVGVVTTLAGTAGVMGSADGAGGVARFYYPARVAVDSAGNLYAADRFNHTIRKITATGLVTTLAGTAGQFGRTDGTGVAARFYDPASVAVDSAGNVYVADSNNHLIRKITDAGVVTTLAGTARVSGSNGGMGAVARFNRPTGVAVDSAGNVYVADTDNSIIRKVTAAGFVTTLAGTAGVSGSADGTGAAARFNRPASVVVDLAGDVYVADRFNSIIRKITAAGVTTTVAGRAGVTGIVLGPTPGLAFPSSLAIIGDSIVITDTAAILLLRHGAR